MTEQHTQGDFQSVKKRGPKNNQGNTTHNTQNTTSNAQKKLSFKELLFERNNLKKYQHSPKVDLRERNHTYVIRMELPGLSQSEVSVQVRDSQFLLVSGTKNNQNSQESDTVVYSECHYGNFMRRVKVPKAIRHETLHYSVTNGVLYVTVDQEDQEDQQEEQEVVKDTLQSIPEDKPLDFSNMTCSLNWADEM